MAIKVTLFSSFLLLISATPSRAGQFDAALYADNYRPYPDSAYALTPAPEGYTPVYISHYGRHGCRNLVGKDTYEKPVITLKQARDDGQLTPYGEELLKKLSVIADYARGRYEELTPRGHREHQGIARRMYRNFPELFRRGAHIDAKSSTVIRCILSMSEELQTLKSLEPSLDITMDASAADMKYIIQQNPDLDRIAMPKGSRQDSLWRAYRDSLFQPTRVMNRIFLSEDYWRRQVSDPLHFVHEYLWKISRDIADTELPASVSLDGLFTEEELRNILLFRNANWYTCYGASPLNGGRMVYRQSNMVNLIVSEADSILSLQLAHPDSAGVPTASLRFGHETGLLPLVCFLNIDGAGSSIGRMEDIAPQWMASRIFPMASNLQLVFYRRTGKNVGKRASDDAVLVKVLLNEKEATLPGLTPVHGAYYRWEEVKRAIQARIL